MSVTYAKLTEQQKWEWHAEVYAFRRVVLSVPASQQTSPCDEAGAWFDDARVKLAEQRLRNRIAEQRDRCAASTRDANAIRFAEGPMRPDRGTEP